MSNRVIGRATVVGMVLGAGLLACWPIIVGERDGVDSHTAEPASAEAESGGAASRASNIPPDAAASQSATLPIEVVPAFAVIDYFQQRCANCHGPYGAYYLPELKKRYPGEALRDLLDEMASGPAQSPLTEPQLDQLVRYHEALADGHLYMAITAQDGRNLTGEVSPGYAVIVKAGDQAVTAEVTGHRWTATLPEGVTAGDVELQAQNEASETH